MRLRTLAAATALGLVASLAPTVAAEAASKPLFKVSITASATKADVGRTIKVSGKVSGPAAAKKRLAVQVKVGKGAWRTVTKVRTTKSRKYAANVTVSTAGQQYVRVVAPKSKKARQGVSKSRGFVGWRWLDLTTQRRDAAGSAVVGPVTIAGKKYAKAITLTNVRLTFNVNTVCDTFTAGAGIKDGIVEGSALTTFVSTPAWGDGFFTELAPNTAAKSVRHALAGIYTLGMIVEGGTATVVDPRVHCSVNALPAPVVD